MVTVCIIIYFVYMYISIFSAIEAVTGARLIITEVRVQQLDNGEVDVAG